MSSFADRSGGVNSKIYDSPPKAADKITNNCYNRYTLVKYVISMFRIEDNYVRPRKTNHAFTSEPYIDNRHLFNSRSVFQVEDFKRKPTVPVSIPVENQSEVISTKSNIYKFFKHFEAYCSNSTLHGLRYVGNASLSLGERLFWLSSFLCAFGFSVYFITSLYTRYNASPIIISINPRPTPVASLPFPAVTICSTNQVKKHEADLIINSGTDVEKLLLNDFCDFDRIHSDSPWENQEATKWENVQKFIIKVGPSCQDMFRACLWKQNEMSCSSLFNNDLTDDGLCCTFNALPRNYIFRNPREMSDLNISAPSEVDDWNPEKGYTTNISLNAVPWRAIGAGTHLGLTVVLDAQIKLYFCSSANSVGFKVLLHNPLETPKMAQFALLVPPGFESRIQITPKISDSTPTLKKLSVKQRMCYFMNEKQLKYYRTYTELNCKLECQTNYTLSMCDCVPFYLPKNRFNKICGKTQEICTNAAREAMEASFSNGSSTTCGCLPACFELGFTSTTTVGKLSSAFKIREEFLKNESAEYFTENMAIVHFYFNKAQYTSSTKSELYGFSEFLSNTGGLLGLFLGFSFLSAVEVIYYLSLRVLCVLARSTYNRNKQKRKEPVTNNTPNVYPFAR